MPLSFDVVPAPAKGSSITSGFAKYITPNRYSFDAVSGDGIVYDDWPPVLYLPEPELDYEVFPGVTVEGCVAWKVRQDDAAPTLVFGADSSLRGGVWFDPGR